MIKLSSRGKYAVCALLDLALHGEEKLAQARDVAERQRIPFRFLEQILHELGRAGLVESKRGPRGGFQLAKPAKDVRLGDVIRAIEGPFAPGANAARAQKNGRGAPSVTRVVDAALVDVARDAERACDRITLEDLATRAEASGVRRHRAAAAYVI